MRAWRRGVEGVVVGGGFGGGGGRGGRRGGPPRGPSDRRVWCPGPRPRGGGCGHGWARGRPRGGIVAGGRRGGGPAGMMGGEGAAKGDEEPVVAASPSARFPAGGIGGCYRGAWSARLIRRRSSRAHGPATMSMASSRPHWPVRVW